MRSAPDVAAASDDDGGDETSSKGNPESKALRSLDQATNAELSTTVEMVDEALTQEHQEIEALVALMDQDDIREHEHDDQPSDYGSDDEDYDRIFMEAVAAAERSRGDDTNSEMPSYQDQEMDMS